MRRRPPPPISLALLPVLLAGCAMMARQPPPPTPAPAPAPAQQRSGIADPNWQPGAKPAPPAADDGIAVLPPERYESGEAARRAALAGSGGGPASDAEAGYYLDVLQARLQQLGADRVTLQRHGDRFLLGLPGRGHFAVGAATLDPGFAGVLDTLGAVLADYGQTVVAVHGHTDDTGPSALNQRLSEQRALAVARRLAAAGVARERLVAVGFGPSRPIADNGTEDGREANRRVEIELQLVGD